MNSSWSYLPWKGYLSLRCDWAVWSLYCFSTQTITINFTCSLSGSADTKKSFAEYWDFLLILYPKHSCNSVWLWWRVTALLQDLSDIQVFNGNSWTETGREEHTELLSWLLISSPTLFTVVLGGQNPSVLLLFGLLMLADGNPAQLSKMLNNLLRTKLLGLRAGSFSFSPYFFFPLQTDFQRQSF